MIKTILSPEDDAFRRKVISVIDRQIRKGHVSVRQLTSALFMSTTKFRRRFTDIFGQTPHVYIFERRLKHARRMLVAHPEMSIVEVARCCGFDDKSNFARDFRRAFGMSPSAFVRGRRAPE